MTILLSSGNMKLNRHSTMYFTLTTYSSYLSYNFCSIKNSTFCADDILSFHNYHVWQVGIFIKIIVQ